MEWSGPPKEFLFSGQKLDGAAGGRVWAEGGLVAGPWEEVLYTGRRAGPRERQTSRPRGGESSGPREAEAFDPRGGSSELRGAASGPCEFCSSGGLCWAGKKVGLGSFSHNFHPNCHEKCWDEYIPSQTSIPICTFLVVLVYVYIYSRTLNLVYLVVYAIIFSFVILFSLGLSV